MRQRGSVCFAGYMTFLSFNCSFCYDGFPPRRADRPCRQTFRNIEKTLAEAGAKLADLVTMTVFLIDSRYTTRMTELRTEIFGKDFPASAAITVAGFAQPEMMIEIQCVAVVA
jgi:enamine deaminase RidA (YjgF/YER057c/UK114 family)